MGQDQLYIQDNSQYERSLWRSIMSPDSVIIIKQGDSPDTFWLVPYNIEQFEPQEIKKASILELYRVIGVFKSV